MKYFINFYLKPLFSFISLLLLFVLFTTPAVAFEYKDATGINVNINKPPRRVICLSPHLTEIVCFLGAKKQLVGRTKFCNQPPEIIKLPAVGGFNDFSAEQILRLKPDLVLASRGNPLERLDQLRKIGLTVYACDDENSLNEIFSTMTNLCSILWLPKHTVFKVKELKVRFNSIKQPLSNSSPTCLYVSPEATLWTCNGQTFISEIINYAGMKNVADNLKNRWPMINAEQVLLWHPDYLLIPVVGGNTKNNHSEMLSKIKRHSILKRTPAAISGKIILVDVDQIMRPSPSLFNALESIIAQAEELN